MCNRFLFIYELEQFGEKVIFSNMLGSYVFQAYTNDLKTMALTENMTAPDLLHRLICDARHRR